MTGSLFRGFWGGVGRAVSAVFELLEGVQRHLGTIITDTLRAVRSADVYPALAPPTYVLSQPTIEVVISGEGR